MPKRTRWFPGGKKEFGTPKPDDPLGKLVLRHWDVPGLAEELYGEKWRFTEHNRIDRMIFIGSWTAVEEMAKNSVDEEEWKKAEEDGFSEEIVEDYLGALAVLVGDSMDDHVYSTWEGGDVYLGQYEDGREEDLRERFEIEED